MAEVNFWKGLVSAHPLLCNCKVNDLVGKNHYQLMSYLSGLMAQNNGGKVTICDIGSKFGDSLRAWTTGSLTNFVHSYDVASVPGMISEMQRKHARGSKYTDDRAVVELFKDRVKFHKV